MQKAHCIQNQNRGCLQFLPTAFTCFLLKEFCLNFCQAEYQEVMDRYFIFIINFCQRYNLYIKIIAFKNFANTD